MVTIPPLAIRPEDLPEAVRDAIGPETPPERRLLIARAMLPLGPGELVAALCSLLDDRSEVVSSAARKTLKELPARLLSAGVAEVTAPGVLDRVAREMLDHPEVVSRVLGNPKTADETFAFVASRGQGVLLDQVAAAQVRLTRFPKIIEALYFNPEARMGLVSNTLEFAVRAGIDLSHIPGYQEIIESIFGAETARKAAAEAPASAAEPATAPEPVFVEPETTQGDLSQALGEALAAAGAGPEMQEALDDESFAILLQAAAWEEAETEEDEDREEDRRAVWAKVSRLSVPQKVRMALMGNSFVRSVLIRDSRRVVYMAVLKSPSTSEKEIITFAKDKALNDEIIRTIANNRDWTKLYAVRHALVQNPKCPPVVAINFLKTLTSKDIRHLSTSHEVPGYIARQAKQLLQAKEMGGGPRH